MVDREKTKEKAKEKVQEYINSNFASDDDDEYAVIDEETITKDYGWLFFAMNKKYLETQYYGDMRLGLGPMLLEKQTEKIIQFGTALSGEQYLEEYEKKLDIA